MMLVPTYRPRASALHSARAGAGAAFCCSFALVGMLFRHPLVLAAAIGAVVLSALAAGVGREVGRSCLIALPLALLIALINPLVYQEGATLLIRGGEVLGRRIDVTLGAPGRGHRPLPVVRLPLLRLQGPPRVTRPAARSWHEARTRVLRLDEPAVVVRQTRRPVLVGIGSRKDWLRSLPLGDSTEPP